MNDDLKRTISELASGKTVPPTEFSEVMSSISAVRELGCQLELKQLLSGRAGSDDASDSDVEMLTDDEWNEIMLQSKSEGMPHGSTLTSLTIETLIERLDESSGSLTVGNTEMPSRTTVVTPETLVEFEQRAEMPGTPDSDATWRVHVHSVLNNLSGIELANWATGIRDTFFALRISADEKRWHLFNVAEALYHRIDAEFAHLAKGGLEQDGEIRSEASKLFSPFGFANANEYFAWSDSYAAIEKSTSQEIASLILVYQFLGVTLSEMQRRLGVSNEALTAVAELRRRLTAESQLGSYSNIAEDNYDAR